MKNLVFTALVYFVCIFHLHAQKPEVENVVLEMVLGNRPAYTMKITNTELKTGANLWEDYVKDKCGSKLKSQKGSDQMMAEGCKFKSISSEQFNLYSSIKTSGKDLILNVWFDLGQAFLNPEFDRSSSESAKSLLVDFNYLVQKHHSSEKVKMEEEALKDAERVLEKLADQAEDLQKDIRNYEDKISKAKEDLEKNAGEQQSAKSSIETRREMLNEAQKNLDKIGK